MSPSVKRMIALERAGRVAAMRTCVDTTSDVPCRDDAPERASDDGTHRDPAHLPPKPQGAPRYDQLRSINLAGCVLDELATRWAWQDPTFASLCAEASNALLMVEDRFSEWMTECERAMEARPTRHKGRGQHRAHVPDPSPVAPNERAAP